MNMHIEHPHCIKAFSWKAVLVGSLVGFGLMFLFNILTVGGGLTAYTKTEGGLENLIVLAYLWTIVGNFLIFFIAGAVTSMVLANRDIEHYDACDSMLHGFLAWVLYILLSVVVLAHVSEGTVASLPQHFMTAQTVKEAGKDTLVAKATERVSKMGEEAVSKDKKVNDENVIPAKEREQAHKIGVATLAAFFVFFVGALGATFGAFCGRDICRKDVCHKRKVGTV